MSLNVLERLKVPEESSSLTFKTVYHGQLKVHNVPHALYPKGIGPDGEKDYIPSNVMYELTFIFKHMINNQLFEYDYKNHI